MMSIIKSLLPLVLLLVNCWAIKPIFDNVEPQVSEEPLLDYRLPDGILPIAYDISLEPILNVDSEHRFTFKGKSNIQIKVIKKVRNITFHFKKLDFIKDDVFLNCDTIIPTNKSESMVTGEKWLRPVFIKDWIPHDEMDFMELLLQEELKPGETCNLTLGYTGLLNHQPRGFYRSSYQDQHGNTMWFAATQFEPTDARLAFPCWDEPAFKANFTININTPEGYSAISNMPKKKISNKQWTYFETTPKMSTYLVAFIIFSDFKPLSHKDDENFKVWAASEKINNTKYALEIGKSVLSKLESFTNIRYSDHGIKKMDQVAVPNFGPGAMENWGLVTYRDNKFLYTGNVTNTQTKQGIATVISHELSHQWFGNYVSPKWWKYIWLNEGFANFFEYFITDMVIKEQTKESWRLMEQFVIKNMQAGAFVTDAGLKSRPMNKDETTPDKIKELFDNIAYKKAGSVIRMMQNFLGEEVFKKGLQKYLTTHKHKFADSDDLFDAMDTAVPPGVLPISLKNIMNSWVNKPGYPVVTVRKDRDIARLSQKRFYNEKTENQDETTWWIPISYVTEDSPQRDASKDFWFYPYNNNNTQIKSLNKNKWLLLNANQTGYYRVNYDEANWKRLATYLESKNFTQISPVNRAQLIDDAFNLAMAGMLNYSIALNMTHYLSQEIDYIPWYAAIRAFDYLDSLLEASNQEILHKYVGKKLETMIKNIKFEESKNEEHMTKLARSLILTAACKYEVDDCNSFVKGKFDKWLADNENKFSPDLKSGIICAGMRNADEDKWNKSLNVYVKSEDKNEREEILAGLGCVKSEKIIRMFLALTLDEKPDVNIFDAINSINAGNAKSFDILIDFIDKNIDKIKKIDQDQELITAHLNKISKRIVTIEQYGKLALVAQKLPIKQFDGYNNGKLNIDWIESYQDEVGNWLQHNYHESGSNSVNCISLFLVIIPVLLARLY